MDALHWTDRHQAYHALRAVLHMLRDRLPVNVAAHLGAQLPMLIRGLYYEGWYPADKPLMERSRDELLAHVIEAVLFDVEAEPEKITRAVFRIMSKHITPGEAEKSSSCCPSQSVNCGRSDCLQNLFNESKLCPCRCFRMCRRMCR